MYNLFVSGDPSAWDSGIYEIDKSRFLEYTNEDISEAFQTLTETHVEKLKSYPCLFAIEGRIEPVKIGRLVEIKAKGRRLQVQFVIDGAIPEIEYDAIAPISSDLDIRGWEMNRTHWAIKDKELFSILRDNGILPPETSAPVTNADLPEVPESTHRVNSLFEFIAIVLEESKEESSEIFYRGHSDRKRYKLEPSLFRKDVKGNYLHLYDEHILYRELLVSNSADFAGDVYTLDRLVRMQHHSLPTRLLDITSNPLIALYFACKSQVDVEGEVILLTVKRENIKYFDSDTASCVANLARLPHSEKELIDFEFKGFAELTDPVSGIELKDRKLRYFNEQDAVNRLIHLIREEKSFFVEKIVANDLRSIICVKGKRTNDRISSQAGAFLLFGIDAILEESGNENISVRRIAITNKVQMLEQLDQLDINESTVFPYIESSARYLAKKYGKARPHKLDENGN